MDQYILISSLNDFIFCPKSIYFHRLYEPYEQEMYHSTYQVNWNIAHSRVDKKNYSTSKEILQSKTVFSEKYWLVWKIDLFHVWKKSLIERKAHISKVYQWQIYQMYAQYLCLEEMWYQVEKLQLYSMDDNKSYPIEIPSEEEIREFGCFLDKYKKYNPINDNTPPNIAKCKKCIYRELCDKSLLQ